IRRMKARWDGQTITFYQRIVTTGAGATHPAAAMPRYHGGVVPGLRAGGRVPGPRAGYDNVMWPLHSGGRVLTQPLEGGEFVVRSSQAVKHGPLLQAINEGTFPTGGASGFIGAPTINIYSVDTNAASEVSKAVLFATRTASRGGVYSGRA
ncbi:MAG TPA: hypothetical protein VK054_12180, partial [Beutenbergiaceae bacterium]|nr:hypothetical protein [Beutenbergiaceae bacterium]